MARASRPWFRFYVEAFSDRKLLRLTPTQRWIWVAVLGAARESPEPGVLLVTERVPMTVAELARYADVKVRDVEQALDAMEKLGMVKASEPIAVCNFTARQFESDNSTERSRKHRSSNDHSNGDATLHQRSKQRISNGPDTETETKKRIPASFDADFDDWWAVWPKKVDKAEARAKYTARRRAGIDHAELCKARDNYVATVEDVRFCKNGSTFLAPETWAEWLTPPELKTNGQYYDPDVLSRNPT